ncbi:MAG: peptidyl-prolyl cis-trans isomerase [Chthoniobacterales bacterium]
MSRFVKLFAAGVFSVFAPIITHAADPQVIDGIAAVVNGDVITFSQVQELSGPQEQTLRQQFSGQQLIDKIKETRLAALNDLVDRQLVLEEFKKKEYHIPDFAVEEQVGDVIKDEFAGDRQAFIRTLNAQGYTLDRFRDMQRDKIIVQVMRQNNVKGEFTPSPQDVNAYYEANKKDFATPEQVKLRMIVLNADPLNASSSDSTRKMADDIQQRAKSGSDFATLAKTYSMDATAENGGDWGWVDQKTLNQDLTAVAFALSPGQVSQVVQVGDSYYLIYCEDKKVSTIKPLAEVQDSIRKKLEQIQRQKATQRWIDGLREKAYIKVY